MGASCGKCECTPSSRKETPVLSKNVGFGSNKSSKTRPPKLEPHFASEESAVAVRKAPVVSLAVDPNPEVEIDYSEKMKVREAFKDNDLDSNGFLDRTELKAALLALGQIAS